MGFLGSLGDALASQFQLVSNNTTSLDAVIDGQNVKYGSLGDFASRFDQSAERRYLEEGYLRIDPYQTDPRQSEIMWQQPSATVLVKKKMFSSIAENYRPDHMDVDERLFYKAMALLFQNKCVQISSLEQLSKIQQVTAAVGSISEQLVPYIITLADQVNNGYASQNSIFANNSLFNGITSSGFADTKSFLKVVDRLRTVYSYNRTSKYTNWITNSNDMFQATKGPGTGVIEITNFTNISTTTSLNIDQPGGFSFTIADPYQSMLITEYDIEIALSDATNTYYQNKSIQLGAVSANQTITNQQNMLNAARSNRNASPISFKIDNNSIFGKPVIAVIDRLGLEVPFTYDSLGGTLSFGLGKSVKVPDDYLRGGNIAGYDGLDTGNITLDPLQNIKPLLNSNELSLFNGIIIAIFQQLQLLKNTSNNLSANYQQTDYARRKLRFNFLGNLIIQPMDIVHIYMNSRTQYDNKVLSGLQQMFSGIGILDNLNSNITADINSLDTLLHPTHNTALQAEKAIYAGPDFPNYLWFLVRSQFVDEVEGTHVAAGLVNQAVDNWSNGSFTVNVSGEDNTAYFKQGKVNFKPGVDAFNGLIFDPLTPFVSNWDSFTGNATAPVSAPNSSRSPQLLDENMSLVGATAKESLVKFKQGALAGQKATQGNYLQDQIINPATNRLTQTIFAPDGLVYKWKQGIGIFARSGNIDTINNPNLVGNPNIYNEPFAGLDVMNVLSLLITGIPYNYTTYIKASASINQFSNDPNSKQSGTKTFLDSLRNDLLKTNLLWGNFVPFKSLVMNQQAISASMQAQLTITNLNADLDKKLNRLSTLNSQLALLGSINFLANGSINDTQSNNLNNLKRQAESEVQQLTSSINAAITDLQTQTTQAYNQVMMAPAFAVNGSSSTVNDSNDPAFQKQIRQEINFLTRRMSYDVRANQDKNLFIVDDYYDTDYDIAAFNSSLSSLKLFSNDFLSVIDKIKNVADLLNLEVFADSQGHIRVRPPQYNKMPSSVFHRMLYLKQTLGIQVFPQFLVNLYTNQLDSLGKQISITEDRIRLICAILGKYQDISSQSDQNAANFISSQNITAGTSSVFIFVSNYNGYVSDYDLLLKNANQDFIQPPINQGINNYTNIKNAAISNKQPFNSAQKYLVLLNALSNQRLAVESNNATDVPTTNLFQNSVVQSLVNRIQSKSGQVINTMDYLTAAGPNQPLEVGTTKTADLFKLTRDLSNYINQWQTQVKTFYFAIRNAAEFQSLNQDNTTTNILVTPGLFNNKKIPEVYEHMIEDEAFDDYGIGSGSRYVIRSNQIINLSIHAEPPPWTSVEVHGSLSPLFDPATGGGGPSDFFTLPEGGNGLVSATAIDYDMWRFYGYKAPHSINLPFFQDPVNQCGPYAAMVLTRNRSNILQGTCTISGNEYMQVGEVIYLEDRNLLFYITSVRHNYVEGQNFTTILDLRYGHSIGDYIPTYLDTIGKIIYKNQSSVDTVIQRQDSSGNEKSLGIVQLDGKNPQADFLYSGTEDSNINSYSSSNQTVVDNVLYSTYSIINANNTPSNNLEASVEIRIYYDNNHSMDSNLYDAATKVQNYLLGGLQGPLNNPNAGPDGAFTYSLPANYCKVVPINLDTVDDRRSPSQQAISAARDQINNVSFNTGTTGLSNPQNGSSTLSKIGSAFQAVNPANNIKPSNENIRLALYSFVIDCWLIFTPVAADNTSDLFNVGSN